MRKAMIVNDSRLEARILADMLKMMGYEVLVSDETQAMEDMKRYQPELLLVNYIMKTIRGDALVGMMKLLKPDIATVLTSSNELAMDAFRHRRVDAILQTPATADQVRACIQRAGVHAGRDLAVS